MLTVRRGRGWESAYYGLVRQNSGLHKHKYVYGLQKNWQTYEMSSLSTFDKSYKELYCFRNIFITFEWSHFKEYLTPHFLSFLQIHMLA